MRTYPVVGLRVAVAVLLLSCSLLAQRADRGIITGVVTDPTGAAVAGATVKVTDTGTGVDTVLSTNDAGAYTTPPLVLGTYSITVDHSGFKKSVNSGILLQGATTIRQDIALTVGGAAEVVEVQAGAETLNATTPDVSHTVDNKYYQDLPTITAADVRLAESLLQIQPGYLPMKPNGDPMFRGSQFNSRINGGQTMATENFFDGAAFGYAVGHQQSHESTPPEEAIQEMKVITTTYTAQYGHTSGGFIEYTSKSGTNNLHGSVYEYFANDALNARGFFDADCDSSGNCTPRKKTPVRNNSFGFTAGGPVVIPHVYNGKNKTFFFTNLDWTRLRSGVLPGFGNTTPVDAFRGCVLDAVNGVCDFSSYSGQLYNPFSTATNPQRDPFMCNGSGIPITPNANGTQSGGTPCNKIPTSLISTAASRIASLMVHPDRAGLFNNVAGNPAGDQTWLLNARNIEFRVDHAFTPNFRMSETFYWNHRPSIRNCGEVAGCTTQFDGGVSPQKNTNYYGNGFYQRIVTHHTHTQFDWIIRNNLVNHSTIAWDRWFMGGNPLSAGAGWPSILWNGLPGATQQAQGVGGLVTQDGGPPLIDFGGDNHPEYNSLGTYGWGKFGFLTNNRWQFSDDLSWVKSKHTIKVGFEYRWHQFPFSGWANFAESGEFRFDRRGTAQYDASGNPVLGTGEAFASFLLGQVDSATQTLPFHPMFYEKYTAPWVNDEFKATNRLTLTFGLRFDYQYARTESRDQYSTFDPTATQSPASGDPAIPGAVIFAGKCSGCSGRKTFESPSHNSWGPRLGFAYRLGDKTAIRGGYGIYYSGISFDQFIGQPTMGYTSNPTTGNTTNGQFPVFQFDNGFPNKDTDPNTHTSCGGNGDCIKKPPFIDPTIANGGSPIAVAKNGLTLPRYQNWSLTFERELTKNMRLDVSYIANRGTRLTADWQKAGIGANMNDPSILSLGAGVLTSPCNSGVAVGGNCAGSVPLPYPSFNGTVAQALRSFPQYQNILWRDLPFGSSMYNALEVVVEQRVSHGLQFRVGYTYSRLNNDGSETGQGGDGTNGRVQNPACPHTCEWGLSQDDTPHVFLTGFTYELPGAKRYKGATGVLLGGWNVSGVLRYESGRPLNVTTDNGAFGGILFNGQRRPDRVKGTNAIAKVQGSFYNPLRQNYFNVDAWSDPTGAFGNAPRADGTARGFPTYGEDMSLFKNFKLTERVNMKFEGDFGNIFNRTDFCNPNTFWTPGSTSFGSIGTQCNQPRSIQFGLKLTY